MSGQWVPGGRQGTQSSAEISLIQLVRESLLVSLVAIGILRYLTLSGFYPSIAGDFVRTILVFLSICTYVLPDCFFCRFCTKRFSNGYSPFLNDGPWLSRFGKGTDKSNYYSSKYFSESSSLLPPFDILSK